MGIFDGLPVSRDKAILRLFSESTQRIGVLKIDLAEAKKLLGARNKQLHQLWYRSVTLRHIIALLDQIEGIAKSECQQLICEILRATPEAASADAAVQTARLENKTPSKDKREVIRNATISIPNQGVDIIRQGWRKGPNVIQEGYGSAAVLPEQGIYLAASVYRPVLQFTYKLASMLPQKYSQLGNDGLLAFVENFVKDHFLPTMFVDYRKGVQQAISSPAAFRPRAHATSNYTPSVEKGRPVLQGLLAIDFLAKEVLGWAQTMPKFAGALINYVQTFLERTYERCRTSYMEALAAIPSIDSEAVQLRLDRVRTYYELLNMPFEALLAFIMEHEQLFTATEYLNLLKVLVPGREIPADAQDRVKEILSR